MTTIEKHLKICIHGAVSEDNPRHLFSNKDGPPPQIQVDFCKDWISKNMVKTSRYNYDATSIGLKHVVEMDSENGARNAYGQLFRGEYFYVCNGAFIKAADDLGYEWKRRSDEVDPKSTSVYFKMKLPSTACINFEDKRPKPTSIWPYANHIISMQQTWDSLGFLHPGSKYEYILHFMMVRNLVRQEL